MQLPDHLNDPEIFKLVKTCQVHVHSRICWKYNKNEHQFSCGYYFIDKTTIAKALGSKFSNEEKQKILTTRNTLLRQVKRYIDNNLNPSNVYVIDPTKDNFTQLLSIKETLDELKEGKEAVCHILAELKLRRFLSAGYFVNTNPPEVRV